MGIKITTGISPESYIPQSQENSDSPANFQLRPLNGEEVCSVGEYIKSGGPSGIQITGPGVFKILRFAISDWSGVFDEQGKVVEFSRENFKFLPYTLCVELAIKIIMSSRLSEEESGN